MGRSKPKYCFVCGKKLESGKYFTTVDSSERKTIYVCQDSHRCYSRYIKPLKLAEGGGEDGR